MEYYRYLDTVIQTEDHVNWRVLVNLMRTAVNGGTFHVKNVMIEEIDATDAEDYIEFLHDKINKANLLIKSLQSNKGLIN